MNTDLDNVRCIVEWATELNFAITVSDINNNIIYMNNKSKASFSDTKIGDNLDNCHSNSSNEIIKKLKENNISNTYTIQKNETKKLIHQTPWYKNGIVAGLVELSIIIPNNISHYNRDNQ